MKRVLIATDGSDHALKAAELGAELAIKMDGAELHILAVAYYEPSQEVELRQFAQSEHLDGGLLNARMHLRKAMRNERGSRPRRRVPRPLRPLWPQEIRPRRFSPTSRPMPLTQSWLAGGERAASLGCFSAASPRSSLRSRPVWWSSVLSFSGASCCRRSGAVRACRLRLRQASPLRRSGNPWAWRRAPSASRPRSPR